MLDANKGFTGCELAAEVNGKADLIPVGASDIGIPGNIGFGVGAVLSALMPTGWSKMASHEDPASDNYGNVLDNTGSVMVWIPKFYFKWNPDNTVEISGTAKTGFVLHRAFIDGGSEKEGFFVDKYGCGNVNGVFASKQGIDPCSTNSVHNPISNLNNTPPNRYGGLYESVKTRSTDHLLTSIFIYNALAVLAHAQGKAGTNCAFADVAPYHPKGCNNNALKDSNDTSVTFTASGYSNCAMTGSGVPFEKTTHNGQKSGVADLNGNMYEVASGFIKYGNSDAIFKILKESIRLADVSNDTTTQGSGGAYDIDLYDNLDLTSSMSADAPSRFGNSANQVFAMNTDRASEQYKMTTAGFPMPGGYSAGGTIGFGNDYYREYWRDKMAPIVGGTWGSASSAGMFSLSVSSPRTNSYYTVGGRASVYL
jgi:hypothetical protein